MTATEYERLYSAAARMLAAQGVSAGQGWPVARSVAWGELAAVLTDVPLGEAGDPAREFIGLRQTFPTGVASLQDYLRADPNGVDQPVVLAGLLHAAIVGLLDELAGRLAPGRPPVAIGDDGADLSTVVHDLADGLREALGLPSSPLPLVAGESRPLQAGPATHEYLVAVAKAAADAVPAPEELGQDFSVRHAAAVAAADVRALVAGEDAPAWRERQEDIRPESHLVAAYRWEGGWGRPVTFADRAAELRETLEAAGSPRSPSDAQPLPELTADRTWILYSRRQALVTADMLDELAVRLRPGSRTGMIHFSAHPVETFLKATLQAGTTEI